MSVQTRELEDGLEKRHWGEGPARPRLLSCATQNTQLVSEARLMRLTFIFCNARGSGRKAGTGHFGIL